MSWFFSKSAAAGGTIGPISVAANADDGEIVNGDAFYSAGDVADGKGWIGDTGAAEQVDFFRFILPSGIPSGATITSAILTLFGRGSGGWSDGVDDLQIRATDSANAAAPTTFGERPVYIGGSTATTTAVAAWNNVTWNAAGVNTSSSLAAVIQELVTDNGGLASGAGIVIWVNTTAALHYIAVELNEYAGSANVATLTIDWTP